MSYWLGKHSPVLIRYMKGGVMDFLLLFYNLTINDTLFSAHSQSSFTFLHTFTFLLCLVFQHPFKTNQNLALNIFKNPCLRVKWSCLFMAYSCHTRKSSDHITEYYCMHTFIYIHLLFKALMEIHTLELNYCCQVFKEGFLVD